MGIYKNIVLIAIAVLILVPQFLLSNFSVKDASAQASTLLRTSLANVPEKKFFGAQIIQIVIDDPDIRDLGKGRPTVNIDGKDIVTVQGNDGRWYAYIADSSSLIALDTVVSFGVACPAGGTPGVSACETQGIAGYIHTASIPRNRVAAATAGLATPAGAPNKSTQWPFIQLFTFTTDQESTLQYVKAGSVVASDKIKFNRPATNLSLEASQYPIGSDVVAQITDYMMNIDPTAKDVFYYRYTSSPTVFYEDALGTKRDITSIFSSSLKFDPTQILTSPNLGGVIIAKNQESGSDQVKVTESDSNTGLFENVDPITKRSDITTSSGATLFSSFSFNFIDKSAVSVIRSFSTKITLPKSDFSPNEKVTVDVLDKDLSPSLRVFQDLDPRNGGALAIKVGSPITLSAISSTPDSSTPLSQSITGGSLVVNNNAGATISTSPTPFIKRPTDILYFTPVAVAKSITITYPAGTAAKLNGFTHVNVDLNGLSLGSFSSASITLGSTLLDTITSKSKLVAIPDGTSFSDPVTLTINVNPGDPSNNPIIASNVQRLIIDFMNLSSSEDDGFYRATIKDDNAYGDFHSSVQFKMTNPATISPNLSDLKFVDEPAIWLSSRHTGLDAIRILYGDLDDSGTERSVVNVINIITSTGTVALDKTSYKAGDNMKITLTDKDLDTNPDTIQTYSTSADLVRIEWLPSGSATTVLSPPDSSITYTFVETSKNGGIFEAVFKLPDNLSTAGKLKVKYKDLLDSEGVARETTKELTLSTTTAKVTLDRGSYSSGSKVYIEVADDDLNTNPSGVNVVSGTGLLSIRAKTGLSETAINADLIETDANSGVFQTSIDLPASAKDSFDIIYKDQTSSGTRDITASAIITSTTASLQTDKPTYTLNEKMTIYLTEPDANLDAKKQESIALAAVRINGGSAATLADTRILANDTSLRETGVNTGVFAVTIQLPSDESIAQRGKTFELSYLDLTASTGSETVSTVVRIVSSDIQVSLDKSSYSWTSRVYITVKDSSRNSDPSNIETLKVTVRSSQATSSSYALEEDSINSGVFKGYVTLTGDGTMGSSGTYFAGLGPTDGKLPAKDGDAVSVQYEAKDKDFKTASATITWQLATISFDKTKYAQGERAKITINDADMNLNPEGIDTITARVRSTADPVGVNVKLYETGKETGIFTSSIRVSDESASDAIVVSSDDVISGIYNDITVPQNNKMAKEILLAATIGGAKVNETVTGENRASIESMGFANLDDAGFSVLSQDQQVVISLSVRNNFATQNMEYTSIVQITNEFGETSFISIQSGNLGPGERAPFSTSWTIDSSSIDIVKTFVWSNLSNPDSLAKPQESTIFLIKNAQQTPIDIEKISIENKPLAALLSEYAARSDLQSSFPEVASNNNFSRLYQWGLLTGVTFDKDSSTLRPYLSTYAANIVASSDASDDEKALANLLMNNSDAMFSLVDLYNSRSDLQSSFPEVRNENNYVGLLKWIQTTGLSSDGAKDTLAKYSDFYKSLLLDSVGKSSSTINLIDKSHTWNKANEATITQTDENLIVSVKTARTDKVFNRGFIVITLPIEKPLLLLDYSTETKSGNASYLIEIRQASDSTILWSSPLDSSSGKDTEKIFSLPPSVSNNPIELRLYIVTENPGEHSITLDKALVI